MKKKHLVGGILLAIGAIGTTALAAELDNLNGQSCGDLTGTWHFVNNQTRGAAAGTLTAYFSGNQMCTVVASKVNQNNQHFYCSSSGELIGASTGNLPGKLVLSDFTCEKKPPPPPK
ncbi:MAG: hypothetical protein OEU90_09330 [Gammaproteobacteria bacterium]|nr:hypothetical protein [Gammaproteobacteria bacterium]MDH3751152.1 hypothetical protein [Gammaproteobacteria bacterium]MDH3805658.1 hypothetical protein [Gammaproteobacteria bacterium]